MTDAKKTRNESTPDEQLSEEELAEANGEPLPDREAMSLVHGVGIGGGVIPLPEGEELIPIDDPGPNSL